MGLFKRKPKAQLPPDGRKYRMGILFAFLMLAGLGVACMNEVASDLYSEFLTGLGMLYFVYNSGNVGNKWVLGKHGKLMARVGDLQDPPEEEDPKKKDTQSEA